ncbi:OmpA family protein [Ferrimonas marina]|uniref:OmpA family protein n=1 Tax=Ferrimonas marina TaxID=299255 RepID=A0A1M5RTC0_9GAMM|nr:OmpA family protein [Ferrimonas marina]SHH29401.1 OmpA family protein [Ferrimonas marina]
MATARHTRLLTLALLTGCLCGCVSWAPAGRGGMAEHQDAMLAWLDASTDEAMGPEHGVLFEATLLKHHLDLLVLEGAELCFPASVAQARMREHRILRQLEGGLVMDAATDIEAQQGFLHALEQRLDSVNRQSGHCRDGMAPMASSGAKPKPVTKTDPLASSLAQQLNVSNQFATDSSVLTPAYQDQLKRVLPLLKATQHTLVIHGHTDVQGSDQRNQTLAQQRAESVARFLVDGGIDARRIRLQAWEASRPYSSQVGREADHSNRRVTIELVAAQTQGGQ